ncbi:hypothetical protein FFLO_04599 [Filobasidium floriforme]|uniref:Uncharacterized protein n=1 Tax=Filobasidium floriforme TaxID=5210 RepID=A0A8K0NPR2_9TREE|nr:hypothetical protein FFLO_04599 [Filobasidium floriforme]
MTPSYRLPRCATCVCKPQTTRSSRIPVGPSSHHLFQDSSVLCHGPVVCFIYVMWRL